MPTQSQARAILANPAEAAKYGELVRAIIWRIAHGLAPVVVIRRRAL